MKNDKSDNHVWYNFPIDFKLDLVMEKFGILSDMIKTTDGINKILHIGFWYGLELIWLKQQNPNKDFKGITTNKDLLHCAKTRAYYHETSDIEFEITETIAELPYENKEFDLSFIVGLLNDLDDNQIITIIDEALRVSNLLVIYEKAKFLVDDDYGKENADIKIISMLRKHYNLMEFKMGLDNAGAVGMIHGKELIVVIKEKRSEDKNGNTESS